MLRVDSHLSVEQSEYACVNLFKYLHYSISVDNDNTLGANVSFVVSNYTLGYLPKDCVTISRGRPVYRLVKGLSELTEKDLKDIKKNFPAELLQEAFKRHIPWLYASNPRIKSDKYKRLLPYPTRAFEDYEMFRGTQLLADWVDYENWV